MPLTTPFTLPENIQRIEKDWFWWNHFLQLNYYAAPEEDERWDATVRSIARTVNLQPGMDVLDLGSGCGETVMRLALLGAEAVGVEHSAELVAECARIARDRGIIAQFIPADMFTFQPDGPFDLILSLNTSFGYGSDEQNRDLIRNIGTWLRPGGHFYLDLCTADFAEEFGRWHDKVAGGRLIVDNTYNEEARLMSSAPSWLSPEQDILYTAPTPEEVRLYFRDELDGMMREAGMTPTILTRAMGRNYRQGKTDMVTTWVARKE